MTVNALIDELFAKELWNLDHGLIDAEVAAKVLEAVGHPEVAQYFREAADRVQKQAWAESARIDEERMRVIRAESAQRAAQAMTRSCPQCHVEAGEPCVTPKKDQTKKPHSRRMKTAAK